MEQKKEDATTDSTADSSQTTTTTDNTADSATPSTDEENNVSNELTIEANGQMSFNQEVLRAKKGTIKVTLRHVGQMSKDVMGHNFIVLKPGTDVTSFAQDAVTEKKKDYIPGKDKDNIIAHTKLLGGGGGGESDTIEFTIDNPGSYAFICSFPGHYGVMEGILIVE